MNAPKRDSRIDDAAFAALTQAGMIVDRDILAILDLSSIAIKDGRPVVPRGFAATVKATKPHLWPFDAMTASRANVDARLAEMKRFPTPWDEAAHSVDPGFNALTATPEEYAAACRKIGISNPALMP